MLSELLTEPAFFSRCGHAHRAPIASREPSKPKFYTQRIYIYEQQKLQQMLRTKKDDDEGGRPDLGYLPPIAGHLRLGAPDRHRLDRVTEPHHRLDR